MIKLIKLENQYQNQLVDMMDEWTSANEKIVPYSICRNDYHDFQYYLDNLEVAEATDNLVPDSTFFALDTETDRFVGAVNIRHRLNERLLLDGGHIGDGVRPSERNQGIATRMIALALEECTKLGIQDVLMVCKKENAASAKTIQNNGGVLENEVLVNGSMVQRYWIHL